MSCIVIAGLKNKTLIHNLCTGFFLPDSLLVTFSLNVVACFKSWVASNLRLDGHSFETCWIVLFLSQTAGFVQFYISQNADFCALQKVRDVCCTVPVLLFGRFIVRFLDYSCFSCCLLTGHMQLFICIIELH